MIQWLSWGYLLLVTISWLAIRLGGDLWWPATLLLFGPRWLALLPLIVLLPVAAWKQRCQLLPLMIGASIALGPLMGVNIPFGRVQQPGFHMIRVLTCNIDGNNHNSSALTTLIRESRADIVALQECPAELKQILPSGWQILKDGELAVLSRYPLKVGKSIQAMHPPHKWPRTSLLQCFVQTPRGTLTFCTVHLPSPRYGLQGMLDRHTVLSLSRKGLLLEETANRWQTSCEVSVIIAGLPRPLIVAGDFNMPVESAIYRKWWRGYTNAFSRVGFGYGWSAWEVVRGLRMGSRVDHILSGGGLDVLFCNLGPDIGSDHLPLVADFIKRGPE